MSAVRHDVPPYMLVEGYPARPRCINVVALKRNNFPSHVIDCLAEAHRLLYRAKVGLDHAREILRSNGQLVAEVEHLLEFVGEQHEANTAAAANGGVRREQCTAVRVAVIGAGRLGTDSTPKSSHGWTPSSWSAVVDPIESRRNRLADGVWNPSPLRLSNDPHALDAAVIATPTQSHHELAMELLKRGIHLLVEKPLAATTSEADDLVQAARQNRVLLQVGHVERFNPAFVSVLPARGASEVHRSGPCGQLHFPFDGHRRRAWT